MREHHNITIHTEFQTFVQSDADLRNSRPSPLSLAVKKTLKKIYTHGNLIFYSKV